MKQYIFFLLIITSQNIFSQETLQVSDENMIFEYSSVEVKPQFPGGLKNFLTMIMKNFNVPQVENLKGKVIVTFIIEKDGTLSNFKVKEDVGHGSGNEAIRVLKNLPKWKPGEQNGNIVRVSYQSLVNFQIR